VVDRGPLVQVMDPGEGRHWMSRAALLEQLYIHSATVPAALWRAWVAAPSSGALEARLAALAIGRATATAGRGGAGRPGLAGEAALDAATRMTACWRPAGRRPPARRARR